MGLITLKGGKSLHISPLGNIGAILSFQKCRLLRLYRPLPLPPQEWALN